MYTCIASECLPIKFLLLQVYLIEACMFPLVYFIYLAGVIGISYVRVRIWESDLRELVHYKNLSHLLI